MQQINISPYTIILVGTIAGFLFGLIPLFLGIYKNKRKYGFYGLLGSTVGGAILGIFLIIPIVIVFSWLILKKPNVTDIVETGAVNLEPVKVNIDSAENR